MISVSIFLTNRLVMYSLIHSFIHSLILCEYIFTALPALMVEDGAFSHKIDKTKTILNLEGHPNYIPGSRVTAIWMEGWIFPIGLQTEKR